MRVADRIIMDTLVRGGCIKTFIVCAQRKPLSHKRAYLTGRGPLGIRNYPTLSFSLNG
jgi:hypothetical protein